MHIAAPEAIEITVRGNTAEIKFANQRYLYHAEIQKRANFRTLGDLLIEDAFSPNFRLTLTPQKAITPVLFKQRKRAEREGNDEIEEDGATTSTSG